MTPMSELEKVKRVEHDLLTKEKITEYAERIYKPKGVMSDNAWTTINN